MARYNTSESSSDLSRDESGDSVNRHSANEEEEVAEAPVVVVEEKDGSDIDGGNVDNFPAIPLPLGFEEEPECSDSDGRNIDNFPTIPLGFSLMLHYKKPRIPPFLLVEIVSDDDEEDDNESSKDTRLEASNSSGNGRGSGVEQD